MLEAKDISFRYGSKLIIDNVSIRVEPGELLVILGANGAGKSTLIKILCGFLKPCSGIVEYDGKNIFGNSAKWLARKRAVLEQSSTCAFDLKVREIVELGLYAAEGAFSKIPNGREIAEISLEKAGLYGFAHRKYFELSGGEMRRVQLARTLCQLESSGAKILFLDEPLAGLDPAHIHTAMLAAKDFTKRGGCAVAVLHEPNTAISYADKAALLLNGKILESGDSNTVLRAENLSKIYSAPCQEAFTRDGKRAVIFPFQGNIGQE